MSLLDDHNVPIGFGMALAQDLNAMNHFASLEPAAQQTIIEQTHHIHSREEMRNFVSKLGNDTSFR